MPPHQEIQEAGEYALILLLRPQACRTSGLRYTSKGNITSYPSRTGFQWSPARVSHRASKFSVDMPALIDSVQRWLGLRSRVGRFGRWHLPGGAGNRLDLWHSAWDLAAELNHCGSPRWGSCAVTGLEIGEKFTSCCRTLHNNQGKQAEAGGGLLLAGTDSLAAKEVGLRVLLWGPHALRSTLTEMGSREAQPELASELTKVQTSAQHLLEGMEKRQPPTGEGAAI